MRKKSEKFKRGAFKRGAASFYIVALSTLILVIVATSFAMVVISEVSRTSNDDLSQSAYDSAMAGVEDAKVAFSNYRRCVNSGAAAAQPVGGGTTPSCSDIVWWVQHPNCSMVGHILGKIPKDQDGEVEVGGVIKTGADGETTTNQAYTCVMLNTSLNDYRATLSSTNKTQTMKASVENGSVSDVRKIRLSWYSVRSDIRLKFSNFGGGRVNFPTFSSSVIATPPTVEFQMVQTAQNFTLGQFDQVNGTQTNRGTLYLVPTGECGSAENRNGSNYIGVANGNCAHPEEITNSINAGQVAKTNDHHVMNKAFAVYCNPASTAEFYCSVDIELPDPIGGRPRNNDTFMISVSLPYQMPDTDFAIEMICDAGTSCGTATLAGGGTSTDKIAKITNTQIAIDSTGRANDLYRRVETRLETSDTTFASGYPYYALQILKEGGTTSKVIKTTKEYNFYF